MAQLTAWVNGRFLPLEQATVHIEDRGFQFADGVYEVIACFGGTFLELDAHLDRLERSCHAIRLQLPLTREQLRQRILDTYQRNPFDDAMLYIQVTRGRAARAHLVTDHLTPTIVITARHLPMPSPAQIAQGITAITLADIRWKHCEIKSIALLASVLGKQQAAEQHADEAFWRDSDGHILEGCATNCFALINGTLVTHPLDHQVLGGITRNLLLSLARAHQIPVEERPWQLSESGLSECMISSTTKAVMPVCRIDGQPVGDGKPGPVARDLRRWMLEQFHTMRHTGDSRA